MKPPFRQFFGVAILLFAAHASGVELPHKLASLTTTKGRSYEKVEIREINPAGIKILHESGTASIPFQELPSALQKELGGFDHKAAEERRKERDAAVRRQEEAIERGLREREKTPKVERPAPAPAPAGEDEDNPWVKPLELESDTGAELATGASLEEPAKQKVVEKGVLSSRIVGYRSGIKRVEFRVRTNCKAELRVHRVTPDRHSRYAHTHTYDIEANKDFVEEVWVYNNYSADLTGSEGKPLDSESHDKKTSLSGGLGRSSLR